MYCFAAHKECRKNHRKGAIRGCQKQFTSARTNESRQKSSPINHKSASHQIASQSSSTIKRLKVGQAVRIINCRFIIRV